jgi:transposase
MPVRSVPQSIKDRVVPLRQLGFSIKQICRILDVQKSFVYRTLSLYGHYGQSSNPHTRRPGRHRVLNGADIKFLRSYVTSHKTSYLDELQNILLQHRNADVSIPTLYRTLCRLQFTSKRVAVEALERNDLLRAHFMNIIGLLVTDPRQLMFTDETSRDERTISRRRG